MQRAFVAGATGYTGRAVVRELTDRGLECIAHVRPDSPRLEEWRRVFTAMGATFDCTPWGDAEFEAVRMAWRAKAKEVHPDVKPGDGEAGKAFQGYQLAYDVLRQAEERREGRG